MSTIHLIKHVFFGTVRLLVSLSSGVRLAVVTTTSCSSSFFSSFFSYCILCQESPTPSIFLQLFSNLLQLFSDLSQRSPPTAFSVFLASFSLHVLNI